MNLDTLIYYYDDFSKLVDIVEHHAITLEQIVKIAELLGRLGDAGKLDIYRRILIDGAISANPEEFI